MYKLALENDDLLTKVLHPREFTMVLLVCHPLQFQHTEESLPELIPAVCEPLSGCERDRAGPWSLGFTGVPMMPMLTNQRPHAWRAQLHGHVGNTSDRQNGTTPLS